VKTKKIFLLTAVLSVQLSFAQFAKIVDKDGYVNIRENADAKSKIIGRINSDEIVYIFEPDEADKEWLNVDTKGKTGGYIHNSRVKYIESYEAVPSTEKSGNKVIFKSGDIKVDILSEKFNYKENKKYFSSSHMGDQQQEDQYKGQQIWGTDGTVPQTHYKSITVQMNGKTLQIPAKEIENLFNIDNEATHCYFDKINDTLYIEMNNSDGAGAYVALFIIEKGKYKGKMLTLPF